MKNKIVLMGYMSSGKSTIAKVLAKRLHFKAIDLDDYIVKKTGLEISEIFNNNGEVYFRKIESSYLNEILLQKEDFVLALGGGTPCYANNLKTIKKQAFSFYINLPINVLVERLKTEKLRRPLVAHLNDKDLSEYIAKHLFERQVFYNQANIIIPAEGLNPETICENIIAQLS